MIFIHIGKIQKKNLLPELGYLFQRREEKEVVH
jgi:hypothetical protein